MSIVLFIRLIFKGLSAWNVCFCKHLLVSGPLSCPNVDVRYRHLLSDVAKITIIFEKQFFLLFFLYCDSFVSMLVAQMKSFGLVAINRNVLFRLSESEA